jgi:hypothetical protein
VPSSFRSNGFVRIVCARLQASHNILLLVFSGQEQDVLVGVALPLANSATEFDAVNSGHYPIQDQQLRWMVLLQDIPGFSAIFCNNYFRPNRGKSSVRNLQFCGLTPSQFSLEAGVSSNLSSGCDYCKS